MIGDASEIADKFKEADVFDQLRTQLNALMYGTTWGQNSTTSDAKAEDEENKGEESEEETLSGVKATVLYDHNAMMLGSGLNGLIRTNLVIFKVLRTMTACLFIRIGFIISACRMQPLQSVDWLILWL